jgi:hypothetical protein
MLEPLLQQAALAGGRLKTDADQLLASMGGSRHAAVELEPEVAGPRYAPIELEPQASPATVTPVQFRAVSRDGLTLASGATQKLVPFSDLLAVHLGVSRRRAAVASTS